MGIIDVGTVAKYFLSKSIPGTEYAITHLKLQKLVYYAQAFYLANHDGKKLFDNPIEAWVHGPVCRELYNIYCECGSTVIIEDVTDVDLPVCVIEHLDSVWEVYGAFSGPQLEYLTHQEKPWQVARKKANVKPWQSSTEEISCNDMEEFYK